MIDLSMLDFEKRGGVVVVVAQDARTGAVLMVAHADRQALEHSIATKQMHYRSRRRGLWHKGATSGNTQRVVSLTPDCDGDVVLARVIPAGPACHTNEMSCFGQVALGADSLARLDQVIAQRARTKDGLDPKPSHTRDLLKDRNKRLKKIGEESAELVMACADGDSERATEEAADVIYHTLVVLRALGVGLDEVREALAKRAK
ncbi:MAG: bifunctional phosphoribosyl-AMP cyclohydrolase/phosphoribosyl-ATP diphosphatase HisIE [Actinobacteria bacterium]|nr:MAG: bifunctional phosphoribosyl-AMP cyclohydrolase/phosphoribosyl-ATP diphosphatase HisIE [Actinomycetota bacterium]